MTHNLIIATNIKEQCSDYCRARNYFASLLKRQSYLSLKFSFQAPVKESCIFRTAEEVANFSSLHGSASTCKNQFLIPFRALHILTTDRTLSFAFSKMQLNNLCVLTSSGLRRKSESILAYFVP